MLVSLVFHFLKTKYSFTNPNNHLKHFIFVKKELGFESLSESVQQQLRR
jgi:hypothetical protein